MTLAYAPGGRATIVVHGLEQAIGALKAAAECGRAVAILSAPGAAGAGGAGWWRALAEHAREAVPAADALFILDCADEAGRALEAMRGGVPAIAVDVGGEVRARLAAIAAASGCVIAAVERGQAFDLAGAADPRCTCAAWLSGRNIGAGQTLQNPEVSAK